MTSQLQFHPEFTTESWLLPKSKENIKKEKKMTKKERLVLAKELCDKVNEVIDGAKTIKDFSTKSTRKVLNIVDLVVRVIEQQSEHVSKLSGKDKKKLAVEILNQMINIKIKFIPRKLMDKIEGIIIGFIIEFAISFLNKKLGRAWLQG